MRQWRALQYHHQGIRRTASRPTPALLCGGRQGGEPEIRFLCTVRLGDLYFLRARRLRAPHPSVSVRRRRRHRLVILQITRRTLQPGMIALEIKGSLHSGPECAKLTQEVDKLIEARETRVIFEMSGVTHADSSAIGVIVKCFTKLKSANGTLRIACAQSMVDYSLKLTKVDRVIEIFPSVDQAAKGFSVPDASAHHQA